MRLYSAQNPFLDENCSTKRGKVKETVNAGEWSLCGKLHIVLHTSNAAVSFAILEYLGAAGSVIIFLPSSIAAAVVSLGTSSFKSKGIPCSRIVVLRNILVVAIYSTSTRQQYTQQCCYRQYTVIKMLVSASWTVVHMPLNSVYALLDLVKRAHTSI